MDTTHGSVYKGKHRDNHKKCVLNQAKNTRNASHISRNTQAAVIIIVNIMGKNKPKYNVLQTLHMYQDMGRCYNHGKMCVKDKKYLYIIGHVTKCMVRHAREVLECLHKESSVNLMVISQKCESKEM